MEYGLKAFKPGSAAGESDLNLRVHQTSVKDEGKGSCKWRDVKRIHETCLQIFR